MKDNQQLYLVGKKSSSEHGYLFIGVYVNKDKALEVAKMRFNRHFPKEYVQVTSVQVDYPYDTLIGNKSTIFNGN